MKLVDSRALWGVLLIGVGIIFLLQNFGFLGGGGVLWALVFGVGGLVFLYVFLTNFQNWWALIPGFTLLGLAGLIFLGQVLPGVAGVWGGAFFLGSLALSFWVIYLIRPEQWWAVIPGGVLLTLALIAGISSFAGEAEIGGLFFIGLGFTFALLYFLPTPQGQMKWAIIPAAVLLGIGAIVTATAESPLRFLWPAALIIGGGYLIFRTSGYGKR